MSDTLDVADLQTLIREFVRARQWEQFHSPKNLAMALMGEAAELGEIFQWMDLEQSRRVMDDETRAEAVRDELADIMVYLLRLSDVLGVDLDDAVRAKMAKNAAKYPVALARGNARKYTELDPGDD